MENRIIRLENLKLLIAEAGSAAALAAKVDTSAAYISQCLSAKVTANVGTKLARKIELAYGKPSGWMDVYHPEDQVLVEIDPPVRDCPVLELEEVESWLQMPVLRKQEIVAVPMEMSRKGFIVKIVGDAMINEADPDRGASPGHFAVIEPERTERAGNLVLVKFGPGDIRIREYQVDGANKFLRAYAINERTILTDSMKILGVLVMTYKFFNQK